MGKEGHGVFEGVKFKITDEFIRVNTKFSSVTDLLTKSGYDGIVDLYEYVNSKSFDEFINENTKFDSFADLVVTCVKR